MVKSIKKNLTSLFGWKTNRKIIVIESDDWGSIRMPSIEAYESLVKKGVRIDKCRYNKNDSLESNSDLEMLFEVLDKYRDRNDNPPIFTTFNIVANPDFEKIKDGNFQEYYYETVDKTLNKYPNRDKVLQLTSEGITKKLFHPEFHGREHLNVNRWMKDLKGKKNITHQAFEHQITGISKLVSSEITKTYQAAFDVDQIEDLKTHQEILIDGLNIFEKIYGYRAKFFVPPNFIFNNSLDSILRKEGIKYITSGRKSKQPLGEGKYKTSFRYLGKKNKFEQFYMTRNALFETNSIPSADWVDRCMKDINQAFKWKNPAVISTHRINFIGSLNPANRTRGLKDLDNLLKSILKKWPDVEFLNSSQLGELIASKKTTSKATV